ncbi:MAG: glycosyltransferase family 4 protein [Acidobacteriota bacterium]|nr:glycosyltransferase family 4 protein [Acidobacteriota bacterium]
MILVYAVHSGNLFGTERMALETLEGFRDEYQPILLCPPGPLVQEARARNIQVYSCEGTRSLVLALRRLLQRHSSLVFMSTTIKQAVVFAALNMLFRRHTAHLHFVHGGASEQQSYGRKRWLNHLKVLQVGVSPFVKQRLIAHGVHEKQIRVAGNFMTSGNRKAIRRRAPFSGEKPRKGLVISRLIPGKRVDLLIEALEGDEGLRDLSFTIYGLGGQREILRQRAERAGLDVSLPGFSGELNQLSADYDFLVHLCPEEPFGLVILEAMAAGLPVLVPDSGGVTYIVEDGRNGYRFQANDPESLAAGLHRLTETPAAELNAMAARATADLEGRFSCEQNLLRYRELIAEAFA